jgi:hypothetical protein
MSRPLIDLSMLVEFWISSRDVERVAVLGQSSRHETGICRAKHRRVENPVRAEQTA